ncbi:molybdate ABC transporter, periplasmic molybdate-binding protein [Asticcacaulis biprosthecium C19]|uniref:Molybdate ABC transporter, periplasmic molybdate-binding protein n=1 Tax=Asticcacaulis biprosthecium C19 TaxID=715226 RepID=F4QRS9_9CAUL|nr:molybdate ABC transporter substrate-binding protein [Asticcacaulis biprosthecium]EGF89449.1 molybdate ABC transporter, periplasmic molybdate-binding protein [Asticcacaulis biprosthecium C19]
MKPILLSLALLVCAGQASAGDVQVAVAANFTEPAKAIAAAFQKKTGHTVTQSFGPSGGFYSQIQHGAPFEVFLSADAERPTRLEAEGLGVKGTRFVYAFGTLVLWSAKPGFVDNQGAVLKGRYDHLAIADPAAAPYGVAAVETLKKLGLYDQVAPKIVKGTSIAQAYSFVSTGSAELGFVALSQVINEKGGSRWVVPKTYYTPVDQQAILLKPGVKDPAAKAYLDFLRSPPAIAIIKSYGYEVK